MNSTAQIFQQVLNQDERNFGLSLLRDIGGAPSFEWTDHRRYANKKQVFVWCRLNIILVLIEDHTGIHPGAEYNVKNWEEEQLVALFKEIITKFLLNYTPFNHKCAKEH